MVVPKINSSHGAETRNIINAAIDSINTQGKTIQDLVADGQLTPEQYAEIINVINGHLKSGEVSKFDLNSDLINELNIIKNKISKGDVGINDLKSDVLSAIESGDGTSFNLLSIPRYKSVTPEKATFIETSTNLINQHDLKPGYSLENGTGDEVPHTQYSVTPFINSEPSTSYSSFNIGRYVLYDASHNYIASSISTESFTTTDDTYYIKVAVRNENTGTAQLNRGDELLPYERSGKPKLKGIEIDGSDVKNLSISSADTTFIETSTNLIDKDNLIEGFGIDRNNGELSENSRLYTSPFYSANEDSFYSYIGVVAIAYYNVNQEFISATLNEASYNSISEISPKNTAFIRISSYDNRVDIAQMNLGNELLPYEEYYKKLSEDITVASADSAGTEGKQFIFDTSIEGTFNSDRQFEDFTSADWRHDVYGMVDAIQAEHPEYISKQNLTSDLTGLEISAYHLNPERPQMDNERGYPKVFIATGTHGYERSSVLNMYNLVRELSNHWQDDELIEAIRFNVDIIWIPIVNPYGWHASVRGERANSNGIDIARQFPDDWKRGDPGTSTYGGEAPLTEIEALNVKQIFDENPDINAFYDYHNFGGVSDNYIWVATSSNHAENISEALIKKMSRKWAQDFDYMPHNVFFGYTSYMSLGTMHNYAYKSLGIKRSGTFETANKLDQDANSVNYDQDSVKAGLESIVNFFLINLRDMI